MAEDATGEATAGPIPGAPRDAVTIEEARRRWAGYRAEVWMTLAEVRGQSSRVAVLRGLRPGSWAFRVVTGAAGPVLALRRRLRGPTTSAPARAFPYGEEPEPAGWWHPIGIPDVDVVTCAGASAADVEALNANISGEGWIMVLDDGDHLVEGALHTMAAAGVRHGVDAVYGDERVRDDSGRVTIVARPRRAGWISLLSYDVTGRGVLFRRSALRAVGGFDPSAGAAFRHDAVLRLVEAGLSVGSVASEVLETTTSSATDANALAKASAAALVRRASGGVAETDAATPGLVRWRASAPPTWPPVTVVIPTRDRIDLLGPCLASLELLTTYPHYDVVIVDNESVTPEATKFFTETRHRVVRSPGAFNYPRVINDGVAASTGDFVVTLNNDVTIQTRDWLEQMVSVAMLPGVGVVGAYLEDPSGHAQHEGVAIAPYPQHLRRDLNYLVPDAFLESSREASAVTGACQLVSRALFDELGGLDESLAVVHNDIDFCLRARGRGREVVYLATVRHLHAESSSRGGLTPDEDIERFIARWDVFGSLEDPWFPARWELVGDVIRWRRPRPVVTAAT